MQHGAEADESFYIQNEARVRGKIKVRLPDDPPPDLVIKADVTHSSFEKLDLYAALGVTEVWIFKNESLAIYQLVDGKYESTSTSVALPMLSVEDIEYVLSQRVGKGRNAFLNALETWVQERIKRSQVAGRESNQSQPGL